MRELDTVVVNKDIPAHGIERGEDAAEGEQRKDKVYLKFILL
jgi:hypothetical protein